MADVFDLEIAKRQLTKDVLRDLGIDKALSGKYSNLSSQAGQLIDEYAKYYRQLFKCISDPYKE